MALAHILAGILLALPVGCSRTQVESDCANSLDDDADGTVDCDDPDCAGDAACTEEEPVDADGDGYADTEDCDDEDAAVYPGAEETCNDTDDDCDGDIDEEAVDADTWYADADGDGYGDSSTTTTGCEAPSGYVSGETGEDSYDCDDTNADVHPGAEENWENGVDDDCDGTVDDEDLDGWTLDEGDCDDTDPDINPDAVEVCRDGLDNDCDGDASECEYSDGAVIGATDPDDVLAFTGESDQAGGQAGTDVTAGDLDGDGYTDLVVSAYQAMAEDESGTSQEDMGRVYVRYGPITADASLGTWSARISGDYDGDAAILGTSLASCDLDGNGSSELVIGAPGDNGASSDREGAAYIISGGSRLAGDYTITDAADGTWTGESAGDGAGIGVACGGDVQGDGGADLFVGAYFFDVDAGQYGGAAYVVDGSMRGTHSLASEADFQILGEAQGDTFGRWGALGDVNGDGLADIASGGNQWDADVGRLYVVLGADSLLDGEVLDLAETGADITLEGEAENDNFGTSANIADLDGDGYAEVIASAAYSDDGDESDVGAVYVLPGTDLAVGDLNTLDDAGVWKLWGMDEGDMLGAAHGVSTGDLDQDGLPDLLLGAIQAEAASGNPGFAYVVSGGDFSGGNDFVESVAWLTLEGATEGDQFGHSVSSAEDATGDGYPDLLVGALNESTPATEAGAAYLLMGMGP